MNYFNCFMDWCALLLLLPAGWWGLMNPCGAEASSFSACSVRCSRKVFRMTDRRIRPSFQKASAGVSIAQLRAHPPPTSGNARARSLKIFWIFEFLNFWIFELKKKILIIENDRIDTLVECIELRESLELRMSSPEEEMASLPSISLLDSEFRFVFVLLAFSSVELC